MQVNRSWSMSSNANRKGSPRTRKASRMMCLADSGISDSDVYGEFCKAVSQSVICLCQLQPSLDVFNAVVALV